MKRKIWGILLVLAVIISLTFVPTKSNAAIPIGWYSVRIVYAGPLFEKILIQVDAVDGSFSNQWFELNAPMQNPLFASALTALSMQKSASIYVTNDPHYFAGVTVQTCYSLMILQ